MRRGALGLVLLLFAGACGGGDEDVALVRAPDVVRPVVEAAADERDPTPTTAAGEAKSKTPAAKAPSTSDPAPPTSKPAPAKKKPSKAAGAVAAATSKAALVADGSWTIAPYTGFGAWLDAYDWSAQFSRSGDVAGVEAIDHMAAEGVQTLYIQATRWNSPTDVLEPKRLKALIDRAHHHGIAVIAWYLPTLVDPGADIRRILAVAKLDIDGIGIDIEALDVKDVAERNRRLIALSQWIRAELPGKTIGAIVLEPVLLEDVNPNYWPSFPWAEIAPYYDVWLPMSYWTNRRGGWRSAYDYTAENMKRVRARIGQPAAPVHTIGGIGDKTTEADLHHMVTAAVDHRAIGGSIYDYRTSRPEFWATLRAFRAG